MQTVSCFWKSFPPQQFAEMRTLLSEYNAKLLADEDLSGIASRISAIFPSSNDERFAKLSKALLVPCLEVTTKKRQHEAHSTHGRVLLGRAWLHLGLFRLNLLVPAHPVDPTAKFAVHKSYLEELVADLNCEIEARQRIEKVFSGKETNDKISKLIQERNKLIQEAKEVADKVTFRTAPTQFEAMYREVSGFCTNFAELDKLSDMIARMDPDHAKDDWHSVISQESMWQDHSAYFIRTVNEKHAQFRDVLHPILISIYQVKHGLRIIADAANHLKLNQSLASRVKTVAGAMDPYSFIMV